MATLEVLQIVEEGLLSSPHLDPRKAENEISKDVSIEKKIDFLENLTGKVSNRRSRRWLNDRLLMELVPRLDAEEIRGLFAPPPWGIANIIDRLNRQSAKREGRVDADKMAVLNAWRRIDCRTRDALRRSFLIELIESYEQRTLSFSGMHPGLHSGGGDVLSLQVQDPFHRLLLHGVCEFYNLASVTESKSKDAESLKMTKIRKKKMAVEPPNITLSHFLRMSKEGIW
ncbi:unnamed protein product [Dovyalis caffra]|uniref:R3H-associated N-terminal domain-containing protein n=1 Tax=Dovyalis caffra TaxID=77055 RepID=A0AAV1S108_9ROSI|nr:unnamed protein product [Dovyalis caffra]